jgi:hypothetical protein
MTRGAAASSQVVEPADREEALRLAQALIRIPSVNPPGEEAAVATYVAEYFEKAGLPAEVQEVLPGRPNVLATAEFGEGGPTLLLNGHTDVVAVGEGWDGDPFSRQVRDGKLYGRGAADMKGPLAAMIAATLAVKRARAVRRGRIVVACVMARSTAGSAPRTSCGRDSGPTTPSSGSRASSCPSSRTRAPPVTSSASRGERPTAACRRPA